jgi:hypothetical protein
MTGKRELTLGRHWWALPAVVTAATVLGLSVLSAADWDSPSRPLTWIAVGGLIIANTTASGVLVSPGRRSVHVGAAIGVLVVAAIAFGAFDRDWHVWAVILAGVTATQFAVTRLIGWPPWRIRPSRRRETRSISVRWLMLVTAATAVLISVVRMVPEFERVKPLRFVEIIGPMLAGWFLGQFVGTCRDRTISSWLIVLLLAGLGAISAAYFATGRVRMPFPMPDHRPAAVGRLILSPLAAAIVTAVIHRAGRSDGEWNRRVRDAIGRAATPEIR